MVAMFQLINIDIIDIFPKNIDMFRYVFLPEFPITTLKWEVLPHPPYSPDVTPSDYHLLRSMAHGLAHQHFRSFEEVKKWIDSWVT